MNQGQIRMTPETMHYRAMQYRKEAEDVRNVISHMDRMLTELMTEWEGLSSEAYQRKFEELRPSFVDAAELIDNISFALDKSADLLSETDRSIAGGFMN